MADQERHHLHAESRQTTIIVVCVVFAAISSSMLMLRLYLRCRVLKAAGLDDWTMLIAQMLAITVSVSTIMETMYGLGRHVDTLSSENKINQLNYLYINIILYNLTMNVIKISFLLQYDRIFHSDRIRSICFGMMVYVVVWAVAQGVLLGLTCMPLSLVLPSTKEWCLPTLPVWYTSSAMNIATDAVIFGIPLPSVVRLQLPRRQKAVILAVFCLGFVVCALSTARILTLHRAASPLDPSWDNTDAALWSIVEMNGAIIVSSVPTLRPLCVRKARTIKSTLSRSRSRSTRRSRSLSTTRAVLDEESAPDVPELHLVDLEELARRSSRFHFHARQMSEASQPRTTGRPPTASSRPPTRPKSRPRPDTGVFVTVERGSGSTEGFETLLARMAGDVPRVGDSSQQPSGPLPKIIVKTEMTVNGSEERRWG